MSDSIQSQVVDAVVAVLGGAGNRAYRCQLEPFGAEEMPADNVIPEDDVPSYEDTNSIEWHFKFAVRHTGQSANLVDKAIDARYVAGFKAIMADRTLGGLVLITRVVGKKWEFEKGELETVALVVTYEVEYSTSQSDPTVASAY